MDMERRPTGDNGNILAVLEFSPQIQPETRDWLGALIKAPGNTCTCRLLTCIFNILTD